MEEKKVIDDDPDDARPSVKRTTPILTESDVRHFTKEASRNGLSLRTMPQAARGNLEVVSAAIRSSPAMLRFASPELQEDAGLLKLAWEGAVMQTPDVS